MKVRAGGRRGQASTARYASGDEQRGPPQAISVMEFRIRNRTIKAAHRGATLAIVAHHFAAELRKMLNIGGQKEGEQNRPIAAI